MGAYTYLVNAFSNTFSEWQKMGSSPYLNAVDAPANFVRRASGANKRIGYFDFQDSGAEKAETLDRVYLELYLRASDDPETGFPSLKAFVYNGQSWTAFNIPADSLFWAWKTVDVTSVIDCWEKVDGCRVYLQATCGTDAWVEVDCMKIKASTVAGESLRTSFGDGLTWVMLNV
ncbi:MAG: hypothetical protein QXJ02_04290 [Candidatus Bathyarchaeia archaeon]